MSTLQKLTAPALRFGHRVAIVALLIACLLFTPSAAMAAKKKKDEPAAPTKSYVMPYFIVMMLVGVGLMTVCRPGSRKDRLDEKAKKKDDE
ncbi:MAG: hypothetical protein WDZ48_08070 [Pirellulales bacterium]